MTAPSVWFPARVAGLPHRISTLLYCFSDADEVLLLRRAQEPNRGLWSPPGGKLEVSSGESPHACACREAAEEMEWSLQPTDVRLTGVVSERGFQGAAHWLMFLFEVMPRLKRLPPPHREGEFGFFAREKLASLPLPLTDTEQIWPLFWQHRAGFFAAHCYCQRGGPNHWSVEESRPVSTP